MEQNKFLTYDGLKTIVSKVASIISGEVSDAGITLKLHGQTNKTATAAISSVAIPLAGATLSDGKTTAASGLLTSAERTKLQALTEGAEVNQNAFSNVTVTNNNGTTSSATVSADTKTDTLNLTAGTNIKITANASTDTLTIDNTYTYTHPKNDPYIKGPNTDQTPSFGGTFSIVSAVTTDELGHVTYVEDHNVTIPALPNVTVTDKGNTTADNAGATTVEVVKALANGTTSSATGIYVDYTTVEVPTKKYVDGLITTSEAVVLKGTVSDLTASTGTLSKGDTYICTAAITNGKLGTLEKGDVVIYNSTDKTFANSTSTDWIVIQANANVYNGSAGFVPAKTNSTASASYFLNEKGNWTIPGKRGIKLNGTDVFNTTTDGTINLKSSDNVTITAGTPDSNGTPITFDVNTEKVAAKKHDHTITANGEGDTWIEVVGTNGTNGVTYQVNHKGPDTTSTPATYDASSTGSTNLSMGSSYVVTGVKYDSKGHIVGVKSGLLPSDSKGVTSITPGTGLTNGTGETAITSTGTLNLKAASDSEIGGIKISSKDTTAIAINDGNRFGVKLTSTDVAYVEIAEITTAEINALFA